MPPSQYERLWTPDGGRILATIRKAMQLSLIRATFTAIVSWSERVQKMARDMASAVPNVTSVSER